jgi:hypothetical protein
MSQCDRILLETVIPTALLLSHSEKRRDNDTYCGVGFGVIIISAQNFNDTNLLLENVIF